MTAAEQVMKEGDTLKSIADCSNEILEKHNLEKRDIERYKYYLGGGFSEMFKRIFKDMNIENEELLIKLYRRDPQGAGGALSQGEVPAESLRYAYGIS